MRTTAPHSPLPIQNKSYNNTVTLLKPLKMGDAVKQDCRIEEIHSNFPVLKQIKRANANQCRGRLCELGHLVAVLAR